MSLTREDRTCRETNDDVGNQGGRADERRTKELPGAGEPLWTVADVAAYVRASRSWVYHQAESGLLPCLRLGGLLRFSPEAVRAHALAAAKGAR
jgi:excisionase family DNA binding protein